MQKAYFMLVEEHSDLVGNIKFDGNVRALACVSPSNDAPQDNDAPPVMYDIGDMYDMPFCRVDSAEFNQLKCSDNKLDAALYMTQIRDMAQRHSAKFETFAMYVDDKFINRLYFVERT